MASNGEQRRAGRCRYGSCSCFWRVSMRHSTFATSLAAALLLGACSSEQAADNEAGGNEMEVAGDESLVFNASDDELADIPPPPPPPDAEGSDNTLDAEGDRKSVR